MVKPISHLNVLMTLFCGFFSQKEIPGYVTFTITELRYIYITNSSYNTKNHKRNVLESLFGSVQCESKAE